MLAAVVVAACAAVGALHVDRRVYCVRTGPPPAVFAVVWSVLYVLLAYALHVTDAALDRGLQVTQLVLGAYWCRVYFHDREPRRAAAVLAAVLACAVLVAVHSRHAHVRLIYGALYVPWCSFALLLNLSPYDCRS